MSYIPSKLAAALVVLGCLGSVAAHAEDDVVIITVAGEAYQGPPRFRLLADDRLIGERTLARSMDTSDGQRLKSKSTQDRKAHVERFAFTVPEIENVAKIDIEFVNDAGAGKGKPGNRNLYILGTFINGYRFPPLDFSPVTAKSGGAWKRWAMLWSNGRIRLLRPEQGWKKGFKAKTT